MFYRSDGLKAVISCDNHVVMLKVCCLSERLILSAGTDGATTRLGSCISSLISWRLKTNRTSR